MAAQPTGYAPWATLVGGGAVVQWVGHGHVRPVSTARIHAASAYPARHSRSTYLRNRPMVRNTLNPGSPATSTTDASSLSSTTVRWLRPSCTPQQLAGLSLCNSYSMRLLRSLASSFLCGSYRFIMLFNMKHQTNTTLFTLSPIAFLAALALLGLVAFQSPGTTDSFSPVPRGTVVAWYVTPKPSGTIQIPAGWRVCDGTLGTPDLRNRFIFGANNPSDIGAVGGQSAHSHLGTTSLGGGGYVGLPTVVQNFKLPTGISEDLAATDDHTHEIPPHAHTVATTEESNLPPYTKLLYIIKVGT